MEKNPLIAIIMATMLEAKPFVSGMALDFIGKKPVSIFRKQNLLLIISGIGKANAAMATAYCCCKFEPDLIFNIGAAGALTMSNKMGEIYQINKISEHDRPDFDTKQPVIHTPAVMDGYRSSTLSTSDRAVISTDDRKKVSMYAKLVDMEGASVVQVCKKFELPCHVFKYVSDTPEDVHSSSIVKNIKKYRDKSYIFFKQVAKFKNSKFEVTGIAGYR